MTCSPLQGAKSRTSWSGEGLGVMAMLKDEESSVSAPWKTLFNANPAHVGAHNAPSPVRENRVTGLYVKTGIKKSLRGKSVRFGLCLKLISLRCA